MWVILTHAGGSRGAARSGGSSVNMNLSYLPLGFSSCFFLKATSFLPQGYFACQKKQGLLWYGGNTVGSELRQLKQPFYYVIVQKPIDVWGHKGIFWQA